jgi:hypothetical protein
VKVWMARELKPSIIVLQFWYAGEVPALPWPAYKLLPQSAAAMGCVAICVVELLLLCRELNMHELGLVMIGERSCADRQSLLSCNQIA